MSARTRLVPLRAGLLGLATLSVVTCTADAPQPTGIAAQEVVNPPLPGNLNLILNARTTVSVGAFARVTGDVGSAGLNGSVVFDVGSLQDCCGGSVLANTVTVKTSASVGHIYGNDITLDGAAADQSLGLDPTTMPSVPGVTPSTPGTTNVSTSANQARQLCPGQYGAISLGTNSTLSLNGGVYQITRLTLADGARLEASEPVVILVTNGLTTGIGAFIRPSTQAIDPMTAADIRIEVGGAATIGDNTQVRAHLLAANGKLTTGKGASLTGAAWAKTISIGAQSFVTGEGVFSAHAPAVPPPCNDNNACTTDTCVGGGTAVAFCRNTAAPSGTSCEDGNICNGAELCNAAAQCQAAAPLDAGASCTDSNTCNGDETCDGLGTCVAGTPLELTDGNACTSDACDPTAGVSHVPVQDGTTCAGVGACQAGVCSLQGTVFSEDFFQFETAPTQCNRWNDFLFNQLVDGGYSSVTMSGTFDPTGITCSDPTAATQICQALHHASFASVFCNGHSWNVGDCGGVELSIDRGVCSCEFGFEYDVRACTGPDWGGVNTDTCDAPSQNLTVVCQ